jgi:heme exporter protein D
MSWNSWADFLAMGGYGLYVWGSLGMCAAVITAEVTLLKARRMSLVREVGAAHSAQAEEAGS